MTLSAIQSLIFTYSKLSQHSLSPHGIQEPTISEIPTGSAIIRQAKNSILHHHHSHRQSGMSEKINSKSNGQLNAFLFVAHPHRQFHLPLTG
jgi:hypothetical protein